MISVFPTGVDSSTEKEILSLIHPRTNTVCDFLCLTNNEYVYPFIFPNVFREYISLFEIQSVNRGPVANGSFLVGSDSLFHATNLRIYTRFDPIFFILGGLFVVAPSTGSFIDYIDAMNLIITEVHKNSPGMTRLIQLLSRKKKFQNFILENFCDNRNVCDRILLRINLEKLFSFLKTKLQQIQDFIIEKNIYLSETGDVRFAMELLRSYIPEPLYLVLNEELKIEPLYVEHEEVEKEDEKREAKRRMTKPVAQKKELAVAKSCMKMTSFFKPK